MQHTPSAPNVLVTHTIADTPPLAALAHDLIAAWNAHDARRVSQFFSEDYEGEDVGLAAALHGPRDVRRMVLFNTLGIPDLSFTLDDLVVQGDTFVISWTLRGTHKGRIMNVPPTGQYITARGMTLYRVRDGLIYSSRRVWDVAGMLRQFGLLPDAPAL